MPIQSSASDAREPYRGGTPKLSGVAYTRASSGIALVSFENVLGRSLLGDQQPVTASDVDVRRSDDRAAWLDVVLDGFAHPDTEGVPAHQEFPREVIEKVIGDVEQAGATPYLAFRDGVVAGGASMRIAEGVAQLTGAATAPAHRRHGVQTALLSARLADAVRAGCDIAVVTTQPGSKSQQNVQRRGFHLLYTRAVLDGKARFSDGQRSVEAYLHRPRFELYDLEADPHEIHNLADDKASAATHAELQAKLRAFQQRTKDPWISKWKYE